MTINLGGIVISDNMYLNGIESASQVAIEQMRTIEGVSVVRAHPTPGGRALTLGSQNLSGMTQGIWCSETIDQIKELELAAVSVSLDYRGDIYAVIITGTRFVPMYQFELEGPYKKFTGTISLIEV